MVTFRDENRSDMDGYHRYYICFHISVRIRIQIRIISTMSDMILLGIDIKNMRFEYSNTDTDYGRKISVLFLSLVFEYGSTLLYSNDPS